MVNLLEENTDLSLKNKMMKLLEENREHCCDSVLGKDFLDMNQNYDP